MKLELVKKYEPENIDTHYGCVALNETTTVSLVMEKGSDKYALLLLSPEEMRYMTLDYLGTFLTAESRPVLFAKDGGFGVIKDHTELFYYQNFDSEPEKIEIENKKLFGQVLPPKVRLCYPNPISDGDTLPVCFQHGVFEGDKARYFAFLELNLDKHRAKWQSWASLDKKHFPYHFKSSFDDPPVIDSAMVSDDDFYVFTSGDSAFVNKWGMRNYGVFRTTRKGEIVETLLDSGDLKSIDEKKRGVYGVFTSSLKYSILTPVFQSDEWKGKQKLLSIATKELSEIEFPRGFGKYPRVVQHSGEYFFVYLWDTRHFAVCREI
jgi:hypothetical protein